MNNINKTRLEKLDVLPDMTFRVLALSNEGIGDMFKSINEFFTSKLDTFVSKFRDDSTEVKELSMNGRVLNQVNKDVNTILKNYKYSGIMDISTPTIVGLQVSLIELTASLNSSLITVNKSLIPYLETLDSDISKMISDKDYRNSLKEIKNYKNIVNDNQVLSDNISSWIDPMVKSDVAKIKTLVPNVSSIKDLHSELLKVNKLMNEKDLATIEKLISNISEKIDTLKDVMVSGEVTKASKASLTNLANGIDECAKLVTNSVSVYAILNQTNDVYVKMVKQIIAYGKKQ